MASTSREDVDGFRRAARSGRMLDSLGVGLLTVETNVWEPQPPNAPRTSPSVSPRRSTC